MKNKESRPHHASTTDTTTGFQLSTSVLITFQLPAGAAFSRLVLVVSHVAPSGRQRAVKKLDATDAFVFALLDSATNGNRRILGRFGSLC
jgi:hypothetical protein